jgi:hypothetical protein
VNESLRSLFLLPIIIIVIGKFPQGLGFFSSLCGRNCIILQRETLTKSLEPQKKRLPYEKIFDDTSLLPAIAQHGSGR